MKTKRKIKKCLTELVLIGLFSGAVTTLANASDIVFSKQIKIFTELDYLIVQDEHLTSSPWSGNFTAINGKAFKVTSLHWRGCLSQFFQVRFAFLTLPRTN